MQRKLEFDTEENIDEIYAKFFDRIKDSDPIQAFLTQCEEKFREEYLEKVILMFQTHCILQNINMSRRLPNFIRENLEQVIERGGAEVWKTWRYWLYFMELDKELVESFVSKKDECNFLCLALKDSLSPETVEGIYKYLLKELDPLLGKAAIDDKLKRLLKKDKAGINFVEYSLYKSRSAQLIHLVENTIKSLQSHELNNIRVPSLLHIFIAETEKSKEQIEREKALLATAEFPPFEMTEGLKAKFESHMVYFRDLSKQLNGAYYKYFDAPGSIDSHYIKDESSVELMRAKMKGATFVTVDIEYAQVEDGMGFIANSVQICTIDSCFFVDTLELKERARPVLAELLEDVAVLKIFHGCEADLETLYRTFGIIVRNIYDTARAALELHDSKNMPGLNVLSDKHLAISINKEYQKSVWRVRPLPKPMLEYALTDAIILLPIFYCQWSEIQALADPQQVMEKVLTVSRSNIKVVKLSELEIYFRDPLV